MFGARYRSPHRSRYGSKPVPARRQRLREHVLAQRAVDGVAANCDAQSDQVQHRSQSPTAPPAGRAVAVPADVASPLGAGNIETVGAQDAYAFAGTAGDEIYVEQATSS